MSTDWRNPEPVCQGHYDYDRDRFLIITGTYGCKGQAALRWWIAVKTTQDEQGRYDPAPSAAAYRDLLQVCGMCPSLPCLLT